MQVDQGYWQGYYDFEIAFVINFLLANFYFWLSGVTDIRDYTGRSEL